VRIPPNLSTKTGRQLRPGHEIASGGEGVIYSLLDSPGEVLKVYKDLRELSEKRKKVECMTRMYRPGLASHTAWPTDMVDGPFLAILMPRVSGIELHDVYGPKSRMTKFPLARNKFLVTVAYNLCAALEDVHATGAVVGDFNQRNILVGAKAEVCFIDCDSFQITVGAMTYWCPVGIPDFLAPEVQGVSLATLVRTPNHDNFTLAVLIFQILFLGKHPFAGVGGPDLELPEAIKRFLYAYGGAGAAQGIRPPPGAPPMDTITKPMVQLFERAFSRIAARGGRPTPSEWAKEIRILLENTVRCQADPTHEYFAPRGTCPWCEMYRKSRVSYFLPDGFQVFQISGGTIDAIVSAIESLAPPAYPTAWLTISRVQGNPPPPASASPQLNFGWLCGFGACFAIAVLVKLNALAVLLVGSAFAYITIVGSRSPRRPLIAALNAKIAEVQKRLKEIERQMGAAYSAQLPSFTSAKEKVRAFRKAYGDLPAQRNQKLAELRLKSRDFQLEEYLDSFFISDASIRGIGPDRLARLRSYNIETAADIKPYFRVRGFGPNLRSALIAWKNGHISRFVYDPNRPLDKATLQKIDYEFNSKKADIEHKIREIRSNLERTAQGISVQLALALTTQQAAATELAQFSADLELLKEPSEPFATPFAPQLATALAAASLIVPTGRARFLIWTFGSIFTWRSFKEGTPAGVSPAWKWGPRGSVLLLLGALLLGAKDVWNQSSTGLLIHCDQGTNFVLTSDGVALNPTEASTERPDPNTVKFEIPPGRSTHLSLDLPGYRLVSHELNGNPIMTDVWNVSLNRQEGAVNPEIHTSRDSASVDPGALEWTVDGRKTSLANGLLRGISPGTHAVGIESAHYLPTSRNVVIEDAKTTNVEFDLLPKPSVLHVVPQPNVPIHLFLGGKEVMPLAHSDDGGWDFQLPPDSDLSLQLQSGGYLPSSINLTTVAGEKLSRQVVFEAIPAAPTPPPTPVAAAASEKNVSPQPAPPVPGPTNPYSAAITLDLPHYEIRIKNTGLQYLYLKSIVAKSKSPWTRNRVIRVGSWIAPGSEYIHLLTSQPKEGDVFEFDTIPKLAPGSAPTDVIP
jgi:DNA-binding helix-hairpin-helix protein with protein kinase domain